MKKLLLIEDNPADIRLAREALLDFEIEVRGTIAEGIIFLSRHSEELNAVILDLSLPDSPPERTLSLLGDIRSFGAPVILWSGNKLSPPNRKVSLMKKDMLFKEGAKGRAGNYLEERIGECEEATLRRVATQLSGAVKIINDLNRRIQAVKRGKAAR